jgi:ABC-2 type transport system permease protein
VQGTVTLALTASLTIALVTPIAFFASAGHGYLPPLGVAMVALLLAQAIAAAGWGEYFPWSIPALYAGLAGKESAGLGAVSFMIVSLTSLAGIIGTFVWWELADQTH